MLRTKAVQEEISSILQSLRNSDLEDAKRRMQSLGSEIRNEKDRGSLLAAAGIYSSMSKGKEGTMQTWDPARMERAAKSIVASQMADEFDRGYAEALLNYSRLSPKQL